ncbi:BglG family transcription antiterminator [Halobacillus sp. BAB-2008]|uniref:BglG family transcription antiterminator n=1 Tax=Halobacillus sp. BAB-2008 TaxID=1246484 RepID=UPI0002A4D7AE|nr:BglG family transcription antiterminator [Halobacillus sp. BAB-2008]ELK47878.1 hypothetical protein D479_04920 [Halobacillus sp. BAB-2008]
MVELNERSHRILQEIVGNPRVTSTTLEKKYQLTRRQLGYSFNKINDWLASHRLPEIERTRQGQFIIDHSIFAQVNKDQKPEMDAVVLSEEQRVSLIILMLLTRRELSLNHFTYELDFSKNTILSDMKQAQSFLDRYHITINYSRKSGYVLEGPEIQIRRVLHKVVSDWIALNGSGKVEAMTLLSPDDLSRYKDIIDSFEEKLNIQFTDEKMEALPYLLALNIRRMEDGYIIESLSGNHQDIVRSEEYRAVGDILKEHITHEERILLSLYLLTTNVYRSEELAPTDPLTTLPPVIEQMIRLFERGACVHFHNRSLLSDKLFQHIRPAYYRIKYGLTETQVIHDSITEELKEVHHLVRRSVRPLERYIGADIPDNELSFMTMLIGGWMTRQGESMKEKVKAVVVCPQGVSVSRLLFNQLSELFPEFVFLDSLSVREYWRCELDYTLVFSTSPLEGEDKVIQCKPYLDQDDRLRLRKQVMMEVQGYVMNDIRVDHLMDIIRNHTTIHDEKALKETLSVYVHREEESVIKQRVESVPLHLEDFLPIDHIQVVEYVDSWEKALSIASEPLIRHGFIKQSYVEAMRQQVRDPYIIIAPHVAIPHAAPEDGVARTGMSLLVVRSGVSFNTEETVHMMVVIAAVDKKKHMNGLMQLLSLAGQEEDRERLIREGKPKDIQEVIMRHSV